MTDDPRRVSDLFLGALQYATRAEQLAYLLRACPDDEAMRRHVVELLEANERMGDTFLERSPFAALGSAAEVNAPDDADDAELRPKATEVDKAKIDEHEHKQEDDGDEYDEDEEDEYGSVDDGQPDPLIGKQIGRYTILERLGRGGMGAVYRAESVEPVRREVALKVIKQEAASSEVIARFEAERQALAMMEHPNIATIFDAGRTSDNRPYFAMELVRGQTITRFCNLYKLGMRERLELFATVCEAVQHAHQKGIIHRDIKPSNVLVTTRDGKPIPKIIDFGIAKAVSVRLTEQTLFTAFGQPIGTPQYMSPEQATLTEQDIDTRSDIYSLGVLLYKLLTGTTPLQRESLKQAAFAGMLQRIREEEPPKPSARLSTLGRKLEKICRNRGVVPAKIHRLVDRELDWIALKALDKERSRRYDTALDFAKDIRAFLRGDVVQASEPSRWYRLTKWVRKHRRIVATVSALVFTLTGGLIAERRARVDEQRARELAERRENQLADHVAMMTDLFANITPRSGMQNDTELRLELGERMAALADRLLQQSLPETLELDRKLMISLGESLNQLGRYEAAIKPLRDAFELRNHSGMTGEQVYTSLDGRAAAAYTDALSMVVNYEEVTAICNEYLEHARAAMDPEDVYSLRFNQATAKVYGSDRQAGLELLRQLVDELRNQPDYEETFLITLHDYGIALRRDDEMNGGEETVQDAIAVLREAVSVAERVGKLHWILLAKSNLADSLTQCGEFEEARGLQEACYTEARERLGETHSTTCRIVNALAVTCGRCVGNPEMNARVRELLPMAERSCQILVNRHGINNPDCLLMHNNLATLVGLTGDTSKAIAMHRHGLARMVEVLGADHVTTIQQKGFVVEWLLVNQDYVSAEPMMREYVDDLERLYGTSDPRVVRERFRLANVGLKAAALRTMGNLKTGVRSAISGGAATSEGEDTK